MTRPKLETHVINFLFICMAWPAQAQSSPPPPRYTNSSFSLTMALVLALIILVFVVISLASACINHYVFNGTDQQPVQPPREPRASVGLDQSLVEMFPVIDYMGVKGMKLGNGPLECAVCLSEFEDDDKMRLLLLGCCHAFHPECIDGWLMNHVTCPVCRSDLTHNAEIIASENNLSSEDGEEHLAIAAVDKFTLRLPEHVQRNIKESMGEQRLAARIAGHQYEILPASRSGKVWSFLRVFSLRRPPCEAGEGSVIREGSVRRNGSIRREGSVRRNGSIRREGSVQRVAPFVHSSSLRSGSLRLNPGKEAAEASAGSVGRHALSPVTAPRVPGPREISALSPSENGRHSAGRTSPVPITGMTSIRSDFIKLNQNATSWKSAPSSPSSSLQAENTEHASIKLSPGNVANGRSAPFSPLQGGNREKDSKAANLATLNRV